MRLSSIVPQLLLFVIPSLAIFADEVGSVDFHYDLLGLPQPSTTFFHRPRADAQASLLYTLSDVGVLGAVNPSNGAIVWRQLITENITYGNGFVRAPEGQNWLASAYGSNVQAWNAFTGRSAWWTSFTGEVKDLEILEVTETDSKDVLVLFEVEGSAVVRRLHGEDGTVAWEHTDESKNIPLQVSTSVDSIFFVGLYGSPSSYSLKVTVLDAKTGKRRDEILIGTKGEVHSPSDVMFVGSNSVAPIVAWADQSFSKLRVNVLGSKSKQELALPADTISVDIHAPHMTQSDAHFLVHSRTKLGNKADVYHIDLKNQAISKAYELPHLPGRGAFSTSSDGSNVYFTRFTQEEVILLSSISHGVLARWPIQAGSAIEALHSVSEVIKKSTDLYAMRSAVVTGSDDWVLIRNGEPAWTRPEGMAGAVAAAWAEIPESEELAKMLEQEAHTNPISAYIHRVNRHLNDLQYLPDYLASLPSRVLTNIIGGEVARPDGLVRDTFGFNKLVIMASRRGRVYALNVGNGGKVIWSQKVADVAPGDSWDVTGIFVEDSKSLATIQSGRGGLVIVKTDTGEIINQQPESSASQSTAVVNSASGPFLLSIGPGGVVADLPADRCPEEVVVVRGAGNEVKGIQFAVDGESSRGLETWRFVPPAGQRIVSLASRPPHDPVASIGRVLGDRKVKYKYLNPNTLVVAALDDVAASLSIHVLDTLSGQVLHTATLIGIDGKKPIDCVHSENWFACTFFGDYVVRDGSNQALKAYQIMVTDLYESEIPNDRGPLGDAKNFSSVNPIDNPAASPPLPAVVSQTWVLSSALSALAVTETRQGITRRHLLAYMPSSHSIVGIPREAIDPRRPVGRDPTREEMEAEGLARYAPQIELDPRAVLSHVRDVLGVRRITASPTVVESTSLLFSYGIDVFGSRSTPSMQFDVLGKEFNKVSLVGTVVALGLGVFVLRPMVRRKQINRRWEVL